MIAPIVYSNLKIFYFKEKLDSLKGEILPPIHVRIKPTNICNHHCSYCAYRTDNLQLGKDMRETDYLPKQKMLEIIEDLNEIGVKAITFSGGGEPLCYPYITNALRKLSQTNIKFAILTNGSRLNDEVAEIFAHCGTWVRVSMDGWDDTSYSLYRGVPDGEYTKIMRNMINFKKLGGKCHLGVSLIIDKTNASHVYESIKRLRDIGIDSVKVSPCIISNDATENSNYHHTIFRKVKEQIKRTMDLVKIQDSYHELNERFAKDYTWCPYLQVLCVIGADGNVYSCQDKAYNLEGLIGTIRDKRFSDLWFDGKDKFLKINPSIHCNHHCVANTKNKLILEYLNLGHLEFV